MSTHQSEDAINELSFYSLGHPDQAYFIHQHVVDAYKAQTMDRTTSPIGVIFSLVGLYLFLERNYSGKQVQLAHMKMARNKKPWPAIEFPDNRGDTSVHDVLKACPGEERDRMIRKWCASVWKCYESSHETIATLAKEELDLT